MSIYDRFAGKTINNIITKGEPGIDELNTDEIIFEFTDGSQLTVYQHNNMGITVSFFVNKIKIRKG